MSRLAALVRRLRGLFRRGREDAETQDELRFHLEMETEKNLRAGLDPGEARRRAHVRLGGADAIREAVRDARGWRRLDDLVRDVGYAFRGLRRNPGFTLAAVVSLAIPIGFNTAVFTIVDSVLVGPLPVARPAQLVDVYTSHPPVRSTCAELVSGLPRLPGGERRVHGHGRARPDARGGAGGRRRRPRDGRGGDRQLLPVSRRPARARPVAGAGRRSAGRRTRGRDLRRVVGTNVRAGSGGRRTRPSRRVAAVRGRRRRVAGLLRHAADSRRGPVDSHRPGGRRDAGGPLDALALPGRDAARAPRTALDLRQGKASGRRRPGAGRREPRHDHGRSGRRLSRFQREPAGVVDPDRRRAPGAVGGRPGLRRSGGRPVHGRRRPAGRVRERDGHAAGPRRRATARDRGTAGHRREPAASRAAAVDGDARAVVPRRRRGAGPGVGHAARAGRGRVADPFASVHLRVRAVRTRVRVHGGAGGRSRGCWRVSCRRSTPRGRTWCAT